jgi:hypothetical protein
MIRRSRARQVLLIPMDINKRATLKARLGWILHREI